MQNKNNWKAKAKNKRKNFFRFFFPHCFFFLNAQKLPPLFFSVFARLFLRGKCVCRFTRLLSGCWFWSIRRRRRPGVEFSCGVVVAATTAATGAVASAAFVPVFAAIAYKDGTFLLRLVLFVALFVGLVLVGVFSFFGRACVLSSRNVAMLIFTVRAAATLAVCAGRVTRGRSRGVRVAG